MPLQTHATFAKDLGPSDRNDLLTQENLGYQ